MSEIYSADMKRLVGVLGDMKKELTLLRKEFEKANESLAEFDRESAKIEYRGTDVFDRDRED